MTRLRFEQQTDHHGLAGPDRIGVRDHLDVGQTRSIARESLSRLPRMGNNKVANSRQEYNPATI